MMKKILLSVFSLMFCLHLFSQPFQIGHTSMMLTDTSRNNRKIPTEIYYPADIPGDNVAVTSANEDKYPVLSFGHGFVMTWDAYQNIWRAVVPEGFIIAFPTTEGNLSPSHTEFAKDIAFVLSALSELGHSNSSVFFERIDTMNCVMGHSMGGGAAFLAANFNPLIKALATLAPAETNPSAITAASNLNIPSLLFAGGNDCITPLPSNQQPMYDSLESSCKALISINGGSHCQMADNNIFCSFGEGTCTPKPTISRAKQHATINRYLLPWLKYKLKNDCLAGIRFDSLVKVDTSIVFQNTCPVCINTSVHESMESRSRLVLFPNPNSGNFKILLPESLNTSDEFLITIYDAIGQKIYSELYFANENGNEKEINLAGQATGIYVVSVTNSNSTLSTKFISELR